MYTDLYIQRTNFSKDCTRFFKKYTQFYTINVHKISNSIYTCIYSMHMIFSKIGQNLVHIAYTFFYKMRKIFVYSTYTFFKRKYTNFQNMYTNFQKKISIFQKMHRIRYIQVTQLLKGCTQFLLKKMHTILYI